MALSNCAVVEDSKLLGYFRLFWMTVGGVLYVVALFSLTYHKIYNAVRIGLEAALAPAPRGVLCDLWKWADGT